MKKKVVTIVGARPQFIKAATLSRWFKNHQDVKEVMIHTGQHYDDKMSQIFFDELHIPRPAYSLNINGGKHGAMTGRMLGVLEEILVKENPDAVLVYGDTNSTLAGALAASKLHIPVVHVEAGLRSFNREMPEEVNRVLTDHVASLLLCPTRTAVSLLAREGITTGVTHIGDVTHDAALLAMEYVKRNSEIFKQFDFLPKRFAFMTIHRQASTQSPETLKEMLDYCDAFAKMHDLKIVFPIHPRTKNLMDLLPKDSYKNFICIDPIGFFEVHALLSRAQYVLTDSGGLQKEAYFHRIPCITLRPDTEWPETIDAGWNQLWKEKENLNVKKEIEDFGIGEASKKIVELVARWLQGDSLPEINSIKGAQHVFSKPV
jgi:UDP-GlcNAc3NAcA epimerase